MILGQGVKIPHVLRAKNQNVNRSNVVSKSLKTLKMVHIKKTFKRRKKIVLRKDHKSSGGWKQELVISA